jgi:hypothetical protein
MSTDVSEEHTAGGKLATFVHAGFSLSLFFDPEDGGDIFLRNVGGHSTDYTAYYPRRFIFVKN